MYRWAPKHMTVDACHTIAVIKLDAVAEPATPAGFNHLTRARRINLRPGVVRDIQAIMEHAPRRTAPAKWRCNHPTRRPNPARRRRWKIVGFLKRRQLWIRKP